MHPANNTARVAGLLYVLTGITGTFSLMYIPQTLVVPGNATATANNIVAAPAEVRKCCFPSDPAGATWGMWIMLWLLIKDAKVPPLAAPAS